MPHRPDQKQIGDSGRIAALDGLRGVAAFAVVLMHLSYPAGLNWVQHGYLAVDFFFALSGFVIGFAYERRLTSGMSAMEFMSVRLRRLYPLLLLGLLVGFAVTATRIAIQDPDFSPVSLGASLVLGLLLLPSPFLSAVGDKSGFPFNPPSWSLFFEFAINFAYALVARHLSNRTLICVCGVSAMLTLWTSVTYGHLNVGHDLLVDPHLGLVRVLFPFSYGLLMFRLWRADRIPKVSVPWPLVAAILIAVMLIPKSSADIAIDPVLVLFAIPALMILALNASASAGTAAFCLFIGKLSYALYITHYPVVRIFSNAIRRFQFADFALLAIVALEFVLIICVAFVAMKTDSAVQRWLRKARLPSAPPTIA